MSFIDAFSTVELKKLVRKYETGQYLFQQGQMGQTMFIILDGRIELIAEREGAEHSIMTLGNGEFLGEKALIKDGSYQRSFGARAQIPTTAVEIGLRDIIQIRKSNPAGMVDILQKVFQLAINRLEKMNHLVKTLRSSHNETRLYELILFFSKTTPPSKDGKREFVLTFESISYYIDIEQNFFSKTLNTLITSGGIAQSKDNRFYIVDELKLAA